jgi:hypothetical protein
MNRVSRLCGGILVVLLLIWMSGHAEESVNAASGSEPISIFFGDNVITGVNSSADSYFEISRTQKMVEGSYIDIYYAHSSTLITETSTLTVLMDDVPIGSVSLDETNEDRTHWRIDISQLSLKPGYHKLSFLAHMQITNIACANPDNAANWMVIYKESKLNLSLIDNVNPVDLLWYPSPFFERETAVPLQSIIVIPDQMKQAEFNAASRMVQYFAKLGSASRIEFPVYAESDLNETILRENRVIWIGLKDRWTSYGQAAVEAYKEQNKLPVLEEGFIGLAVSPWNDKYTNLLISGGDADLGNAAAILTDEMLYSQLRGTYSGLADTLIKREQESELQTGRTTTVSFQRMGYSNIIIENVLEGSASINYNLPSNWDIADGAKLRLKYSNSKSVNQNQSIMSIRINGTPVGSRYLRETDDKQGIIEIDIPQDLISIRRTLEIQVYFQFINDAFDSTDVEGCSDISLKGNWAVINPLSTITFTPIERQGMNLQSMPYPFIVNNRWKETTVVLSDSPKREQLTTLMTLLGILGRDATDNSELQIMQASTDGIESALKDRNIIYLGTSKNLPSILGKNKHSSVRYEDGKVLSNTNNIEILRELQTMSAVVELARSPLNEDYNVLVMATTTSGKLSSISRGFVNPDESGKIIGKFVIIDALETIHNFPVTEIVAHEPVVQADPMEGRWFFYDKERDVMSGSVFLLIVLIMASATTLILWHMIRRR